MIAITAVALGQVNDIHGGGIPPGSYSGMSTPFVMREMMEMASTKEQAHAIARRATRTWGVWLGVGDGISSSFFAIEYMRASAVRCPVIAEEFDVAVEEFELAVAEELDVVAVAEAAAVVIVHVRVHAVLCATLYRWCR